MLWEKKIILEANFKKNPKQVTEYKNLVLYGKLDPKETATMIADIPHLKEKE